MARALAGEEVGSVVAVCFTHAQKRTGEHGFSLNVATNRSYKTSYPNDRKLYDEDKNASRALVTVLNTLYSQQSLSSSLVRNENELLRFLVKRSKSYVIKKAESIHRQAPGLGTTLAYFSEYLLDGQHLAMDWVGSIKTLVLHVESLLAETDPEEMIARIRTLSDHCASLLTTPVFRKLMCARLYTLERGTPDVFDSDTIDTYNIPEEWDAEDIVRTAKFGRQLDRFSSFKTGASAIVKHIFPDMTAWVQQQKKPTAANPFFALPVSIGDELPAFINTPVHYIIPPNIWTRAIIQMDSRLRLAQDSVLSLEAKTETAWSPNQQGFIKVHCEVKLFHAILRSRRIVFGKSAGISKGCCFSCDIYLREFNQEKWPDDPLRCSATSRKVHSMWAFPDLTKI